MSENATRCRGRKPSQGGWAPNSTWLRVKSNARSRVSPTIWIVDINRPPPSPKARNTTPAVNRSAAASAGTHHGHQFAVTHRPVRAQGLQDRIGAMGTRRVGVGDHDPVGIERDHALPARVRHAQRHGDGGAENGRRAEPGAVLQPQGNPHRPAICPRVRPARERILSRARWPRAPPRPPEAARPAVAWRRAARRTGGSSRRAACAAPCARSGARAPC